MTGLALIAVILAACPAPCALAQIDGAYGAPPSGLMGRYFADPNAVRRELVAAGRTSRASWPPPALLLLADAHMRGAQMGAAHRVFDQVLAQATDPEATGWAHLGLGWTAMVKGDFSEARQHFDVVAAGPWSPDIAAVLLGIVDAAEGRGAGAVAKLEQIAGAPDTAFQVRGLTWLAAAYARYWVGDFEAAAAAFERAARAQPLGPLLDDALYGFAWSLYRSGDRAAAIEALRAVGGDQGEGEGVNPARVPMSLLNLEVRSMLRASITRYQRAAIGQPRELLVALLDGDGGALARGALVRLGEEPPDPSPADAVVAAADPASDAPTAAELPALGRFDERSASRPPAPAFPVNPEQPRAAGRPFPWLSLALAAALLAVAVWWAAGRRQTRVR